MTSQNQKSKRVLLMGCGSVGGVIAGGLLKAGHDVSLVTHNETITSAINTSGLRVTTPEGQWTIAAPAHTHVDALTSPFDVVLLAMKATSAEEAVTSIAGRLAPDGYVVTLQNGIVEDRVGALLGRERVVGALVGWGATMHAPGVYEMTSRGELTIGELDNAMTDRVRDLKAILDDAVSTTISTNIYGVLWSKLAINCVITTLGAVSGQLLGEMLKHSSVRHLGLVITSEIVDVAEAYGIKMEPVGGTLDIHKLYLPPERREKGFGLDILPKHIIMRVVGLKYRNLKSSMLQSLERNRRPEIDFMNGYVVERGREKGVATPVNAALTTMVQELDTGDRDIMPANLDELMGLIREKAE